MKLILSVIALVLSICSPVESARFGFLLGSGKDCYHEQMDARTSTNKMLFRYSIMEPEYYDLMDVSVISPSGLTLYTANSTQNEYKAWTVRESGLFSFCFKKKRGASKNLKVYYAVDFISTGSRTLTSYPSSAGSVSKDSPQTLETDFITLKNGNSGGVMEFDIGDVSSGVMHDNTRVIVTLTIDYAESENQEIKLIALPKGSCQNPTFNSLRSFVEGNGNFQVLDATEVVTGENMFLDITDHISRALERRDTKLCLGLLTNQKTEVKVFSMQHSIPQQWPMIVFEDIGADVMQEIAFFKEKVFALRGELSTIILRERVSRDAAESTNSNVKWASFIVNVALVGTFIGQVGYVRKLLKTGIY